MHNIPRERAIPLYATGAQCLHRKLSLEELLIPQLALQNPTML
jgi:hypothetical protein